MIRKGKKYLRFFTLPPLLPPVILIFENGVFLHILTSIISQALLRWCFGEDILKFKLLNHKVGKYKFRNLPL